jgi:hypothetical protein
MLREHFDHRGTVLGENIPIDSPVPCRIAQVVRQHERIIFETELPEFFNVGGSNPIAEIIREQHTLISKGTRMPFETKQCHERIIAIGVSRQSLDLGPGCLQAPKSINPILLSPSLHRRHVMPARMTRESEKIQVRPSNVDRALERSFSIPETVVVMDVTEINQLSPILGI